jgi:hypothetical protein
MERSRDFKGFRGLMEQLCAVRGMRASDAFIEAYWFGLADVSFEEVAKNTQRFIATATKDTRLPTPRELRNHPPLIDGAEPWRAEAEARSEQAWRELKARDPIAFAVEYEIAMAARHLSQASHLDPDYTPLLKQYQHWSALRYAPREAQEAAVARTALLRPQEKKT